MIPGSGERREYLPTPVFLLGEIYGQRSLAGYRPEGHKKLDTTEQLTLSFFQAAQGLPCPALIPRLLESHVPGPLGFLYTQAGRPCALYMGVIFFVTVLMLATIIKITLYILLDRFPQLPL